MIVLLGCGGPLTGQGAPRVLRGRVPGVRLPPRYPAKVPAQPHHQPGRRHSNHVVSISK